jgi:bifunctional non-homologous end joining protein LigD
MASQSRTTKKRRAPTRTRAQLEEYRRKRDFDKTAEPSGDVETAKRRAGELVFVIQKHAASHLHYDLRLELDGVMRSWAVPKGPSLDPAMKRLAMQVEDHPMDYNSFEGTIPKGEYGGGTVMLWDRGTYSPDEAHSGESDEDAVRRGLKAGKLSFTFHGDRLRGSYALVRTDRGPKPKWLLIKHRDEEVRTTAPDITEEVITSVDTGRTMEEIAGESDRVWRSNRGGRRGGEEKRAATAAPPAIAPMKPTPERTLPAKPREWIFEPWLGGERVLAYVTPEVARLADERARDITAKHRAIAASLVALAARAKQAFVLDGEIAHKAFFVSDLLLLDADVLMDKPWRTRRAALDKLFHRRRVALVKVQQTSDDGEALLEKAGAEGWPGIVAHARNGSYEPGVRSAAMLRIAAT